MAIFDIIRSKPIKVQLYLETAWYAESEQNNGNSSFSDPFGYIYHNALMAEFIR